MVTRGDFLSRALAVAVTRVPVWTTKGFLQKDGSCRKYQGTILGLKEVVKGKANLKEQLDLCGRGIPDTRKTDKDKNFVF